MLIRSSALRAAYPQTSSPRSGHANTSQSQSMPQDSVTFSEFDSAATIAMTTVCGVVTGIGASILSGAPANGMGMLMAIGGGVAGAVLGSVVTGDF